MVKSICYYSFCENSGYGLSALSYIQALIKLGCHIRWIPLIANEKGYIYAEKQQTASWLKNSGHDTKLSKLVKNSVEYQYVITHTVPEYWPALIERDKINIGYTAWETSQMPAHWFQLLRCVDRLFVPSSFVKSVFHKTDPQLKISVVPHIIETQVPVSEQTENEFNSTYQIKENTQAFYSINAWNTRKSLSELIHAFLLSFSATDDVCLIIKTDKLGFRHTKSKIKEPVAGIVSEIIDNYPEPARVILIDNVLSDSDIAALHQRGDVFVSLSRGEGWGMGAAEALEAGNPVMITGWGGHLEFLTENYIGLLDYKLIPVNDVASQSSYQSNQRWAHADLNHVLEQFQSVSDQYDVWKNSTLALKQDLFSFRPEPVGRLFITELEFTTKHHKSSCRHIKASDIAIQPHALIPNHFHFVFGLKPQLEPFHLLYYLCLKSCIEINNPQKISFYYHFEPHGPWWERIKLDLDLIQVDLEEFVSQSSDYINHSEGQFIHTQQLTYAHHADFIRLKALIECGGVYADMDTLFVNPYPESLYSKEFVIGEEGTSETTNHSGQSSLCNALMMSRKNARFPKRWLNNMYQVFDGTWSKHSNQEAVKLAKLHPDDVYVLPKSWFCPFDATNDGIADIFKHNRTTCQDLYSIHLWNHLWWEATRTDFSAFNHHRLTEEYILNNSSTYATIARRYLD